MTPETHAIAWRKSTRCGSNACVEVGRADNGDYLMRDSKNPEQPPLRFTKAEWVSFLGDLRPGQLDVM